MTDAAREGLEALASRYGVTLETLAARLDLSVEVYTRRSPIAHRRCWLRSPRR
jgi:hypothetical protein